MRHVIHIPSLRIVNLLCCGGYFSSIAFIDANTKNKSPYPLEVSQPYLQNCIRTSPRASSGPCEDGLLTSAGNVFKTSAGDAAQHYIQNIMGTSSGRYIGKSSGRHISTSKGRRQRVSSGRWQGTSLSVTQRTTWGRLQDVFWERPQDVLET